MRKEHYSNNTLTNRGGWKILSIKELTFKNKRLNIKSDFFFEIKIKSDFNEKKNMTLALVVINLLWTKYIQ